MSARYPLEPLLDLTGGIGEMTRMGFDNGELYRAKRVGLTELLADRWAVRCGYHPANIWPDWWVVEDAAQRRARLNRESERRRYQESETKRARRLETRRRYYAENADYERAQARRRYAASKEIA